MNSERKLTVGIPTSVPIIMAGGCITAYGVFHGNAAEIAGGVSLIVTGAGVKSWGYGIEIKSEIKKRILEPLRRDVEAARVAVLDRLQRS